MGSDRKWRARRRFLQGRLALASLGLVSGCGIASRFGQQRKAPRIGYLTGDWPGTHHGDESLELGLGELGYAVGETIAIDCRFAEGSQDRLAADALQLVELGSDIIVTVGGTTAARAAKAATSTIPIVIVTAFDPVEDGLVNSLARPGANITGLTLVHGELARKRMELLRDAVPTLTRVAVLWQAGARASQSFGDVQDAAQKVGLQVQSVELQGLEDIERGFEAAAIQHADAFITVSDAITTSYYRRLAELGAQRRLPGMHTQRLFVEAGGLMAYGPNRPDVIRRSAAYIDKILKGAKPADLPIEQPIVFDFVINLRTARAQGLTIPSSILQQATETIQ